MVALQAVQQAVAPSTPARKRRKLERHLSDEKENLPFALTPLAGGVPSKESESQAFACSLRDARSTQQLKRPAPDAAMNDQAEVYPLVGREQECEQLDSFLSESLGSGPGNGGSLYISGGPGTGKTCSVRASINKWRSRAPDTRMVEVNCMQLTQRSLAGVLQHILSKIGCRREAGSSMQGLAMATAANLARLAPRVVIVVDEVDQLVNRGKSHASSGAFSLEALFALPRLLGAPALAIIAIANSVDLLERTATLSSRSHCRTILFETYNKDQLKNIVTSRVNAVEGGPAALKALGPIKLELRIRQVAKECGDCRQILALIEETIFDAKSACADAMQAATQSTSSSIQSETPLGEVLKRVARPLMQSNRNDPLQALSQLPLAQKLLLSALATSKQEATKVSSICSRYKELCHAVRQPDNLGSRGQVNSALSALEQRGLLEMRMPRGAAHGRGKSQPMLTEATAELSVSCDALSESLVRALRSEGFGDSMVKLFGLTV